VASPQAMKSLVMANKGTANTLLWYSHVLLEVSLLLLLIKAVKFPKLHRDVNGHLLAKSPSAL